MTESIYHVQLSPEQRQALIQMQYTGSVIACLLYHNRQLLRNAETCELLYQQWAWSLNTIQPMLWEQLDMGNHADE